MSQLLRRTLLGLSAGLLLYLGIALALDAQTVAASVGSLAWTTVATALALSSANYGLRFAKWELCLYWLDVRGTGPEDATDLGLGRSLLIYLAGLSMSVTPGKVGEVLRSTLLEASDGVPFVRTAPCVAADRLTDVLALLLLALTGIGEHGDYLAFLIGGALLVAAGIAVLASPRVLGGLLAVLERVPMLGPLARRAQGAVRSAATLMGPVPLVSLTLLSVLGWGLECIGYFVVLNGFVGVQADLGLCVFLWATTTLVGALSFLPGGLGATEGSLAVLAAQLVRGVTDTVAFSSTLVIRLCTLWWGEAVGAIALALFMRNPVHAARAADGEGGAGPPTPPSGGGSRP